jgi:ornithine cyclodeaminase/alanine dehydrogenase-like protein (mu-crystallin family)
MALFLDEHSIAGLLTMDDALAAIEDVFREDGMGRVASVPRTREPLSKGILRIAAAVLNHRGYYGVRIASTTVSGRNTGRLFCLYKEDTAELCAVIDALAMGVFRTGAASGVATRHLARPDAKTLGIIGAGRQAATQADAIVRVRPIERIRVFSRSPDRREAFCADLRARLGVQANAVETAEQAVVGADIVVTATTATTPVLHGRWLAPGMHVNAIGAHYEHRRELDCTAVARADVIATDDLEQARREAMDLVQPAAEGLLDWQKVRTIGSVVASPQSARRSPNDITLFKSLGVAMEDVALGIRAYETAVGQGVGLALPALTGRGGCDATAST